jgi:hypothetical protein
LSDLNYLVRVARNKEIVVNVNKMKRCYRETSPPPPIPTGTPLRELEETDQERTNSPIPFNRFENNNGSVLTPPVETNEENADQTQDPTWEPRVQLETRTTGDGIEAKHGYWLRSRLVDRQVASGADIPEIMEKQMDNDGTRTESLASQVVETGPEQMADEGNFPTPRYNFRPLPGRHLSNP